MHGHLLPLIAEVDFTSSVSLGSVLVSGVGALVYILIRYRIDKRATAERVWQSEHAAQKERADRLQREKDEQQETINEQGAEVLRLRVRCAELEGRPDLGMLKSLVETQAHAGHEMAQALMAQIASHDKHAMEGLTNLSSEFRRLIQVMERREARFRRDDQDDSGDRNQ